MLDTSIYEVELEDGSVDMYHANVLVEHIYSQVDNEGYLKSSFDSITNYCSTPKAMSKISNAKTTKGWSFCVRLKSGDTMWVDLKDLKEANPIELSHYAVANELDQLPTFSWWVPHTLRRCKHILKAMKKRYFRTNQKYGIELPHSVARTLQIDKETITTFWKDTLEKEMKAMMIDFNILPKGAERPPGYETVHCHVIFDIKMDSLQRKARYVCGGHTTNPPENIVTFASVVSRKSVRIAFTLAALNGLNIETADVPNTYLNATSREKLVTKCGPEFGSASMGRWALIVRALYGSKSAAASWRAAIVALLQELGFVMC
jgi:Reverse transcriptase (RNA-dependent DNA polymerase)